MRKVIRSMLFAVLQGSFMVASAQLPPKIIVDKHLIHAEQLYAAEDYAKAFKVMEKIVALQKEHNLTLTDEFHFKYARVPLSVDSTQIAFESVNKYLSATGKERQLYKEALTLLVEAEGNKIKAKETEIKAEQMCAGKSKRSECWQELASHPQCYIWIDDHPHEVQTVTWTGKCSDKLAQGKGTLFWDGPDEEYYFRETGYFQNGKPHGQWVTRYPSGVRQEGLYIDGKKHGQWVRRDSTGKRFFYISYVKGKEHGEWAYRHGDGTGMEGFYMDGKAHGQWVFRYSDGIVGGGSYVDDKRHGQWIERDGMEKIVKGPYVDGKKHGEWVTYFLDGTIREKGPYVDGKKHGEWVTYFLDGTIREKGPYVDGKEHGEWVRYYSDDKECWSATYHQGEVVGKSKKVNKKMCGH